jgi:hypothetical protein
MPEGSSEAIGTGRCQGTRAALPSSDLTDGEWALVGSLIPPAKGRGACAAVAGGGPNRAWR